MNPIDLIGVWVGVFITLMVLSFLYKENPFFRLTEYAFIGLAAGYALAASLRLFVNQALNPIFVDGNLTFIVPVILGCAILRPVHEEILVTIPAALESRDRLWFRGHYLERICNVFCETTDRNHDSSLYGERAYHSRQCSLSRRNDSIALLLYSAPGTERSLGRIHKNRQILHPRHPWSCLRKHGFRTNGNNNTESTISSRQPRHSHGAP